MKLTKSTGIFCLSVGILNFALWTYLIISGSVPDIENQLISFIFHWVSEIIMAILLIISGISIFTHSSRKTEFLYLSLGFLFNASIGALGFYIINYDLVMVIIMTIIVMLTLFFIIVNYNRIANLIFTLTGLVIYSGLNVIGHELNKDNGELIVYVFPSVILAALLILKLFNDAKFKT
jgi:hypothetical protein